MTRKHEFKKVVASALLTGLSACMLASSANAEPRYGVCRQEITNYVQNTLGQTITKMDIQGYAESLSGNSMDLGSILVYVEECSGFHAFDIYGTEDRCENIPHYGSPRNGYTSYNGAYEGCKAGR